MSILPPALSAHLELALGDNIVAATRLTGGMINEAAQVETRSARFFVKWNVTAPDDFFTSEADGLARLAATRTLRLPRVCLVGERTQTAGAEGSAVPPYLVLEWLEPSPPAAGVGFTRRLAEGLAALHQTARAPDGRFGLDTDNYIGSLPQSNLAAASWPAFYRDRRILPQVALARRSGLLSPSRETLLQRLADAIEEVFADFAARPVLVHGDLWSGNYLCVRGEPVLVDPAVYYADREVELAYIQLFGGFPPGFVEAYHEIAPLANGYERRRALHQLYPLLVHLNLFGEEYGPRVEAACRPYVR